VEIFTPLNCFLAGVAFAVLGAGLVSALLWFSVRRSIAESRGRFPDSFTTEWQNAGALHQRLLAIEKRLSALEEQKQEGIVAERQRSG
jgi:hypothetical protein